MSMPTPYERLMADQTRPCRIGGCPTPAAKRRTVCYRHQYRIRRYGDPHFTTWTTADDTDVAAIIREARPAPGLTRLERVLVAQGLTDHGLPAHEIARILGVTPRTVYRWRGTASPLVRRSVSNLTG